MTTPEKSTRPHSAFRDPKAGFVKIPVATSSRPRRGCCCGHSECKIVSKAWVALGDIRGAMFQLPAVSDQTRKRKQREIKAGRLNRINAHLNTNSEGSVDRRNRSKEGPPMLTRGEEAKKTPARHVECFAAHHIDPIILSKFQREDTVPLSFLKENGLWGNGFTDADKVKHLDGAMCCYVVPSYSLENTKHDLVHVQRNEELNDLIAKVVERRKVKHQLRSANNNPKTTTPDMNNAKRQKLSSSAAYTEDLEAAICMLHEQLEAFTK